MTLALVLSLAVGQIGISLDRDETYTTANTHPAEAYVRGLFADVAHWASSMAA